MSNSNFDFGEAFWPGFFGNLASDILVATVLVFVLARLGKIFKSGAVALHGTAELVGPNEMEMDFQLINTGALTLREKEAYWHVFIDAEVSLVSWEAPEVSHAELIVKTERFPADEPDQFFHFQGFNQNPVFIETGIEILSVRIGVEPGRRYNCRYFLTTEFGKFPRLSFWKRAKLQVARLLRRPGTLGTNFGFFAIETE